MTNKKTMLQKLFQPRFLLHLEGALTFLFCVWLYGIQSGNWMTFALLFFLPDLSVAGYLVNASVGATIYNAAHSMLLPSVLAAYGLLSANALAISLALIWFAHLGFDRMLGFGLKYPTRFSDTHLNRV